MKVGPNWTLKMCRYIFRRLKIPGHEGPASETGYEYFQYFLTGHLFRFQSILVIIARNRPSPPQRWRVAPSADQEMSSTFRRLVTSTTTTSGLTAGPQFSSNGTQFSSHGRDFSSYGRQFSSNGRHFSSNGRQFSSHGSDFSSHGRQFSSHGGDLQPSTFSNLPPVSLCIL